MYSARGVIALRSRGVISVKLRGVIKCPEVMHDRLCELPAIDSTAALGWVQHAVRSLLRAVDSFGQADAGRARGDVCSARIAPATDADKGAGVAGAATAGCADRKGQATTGVRPVMRGQ